MDVRTTTLGDLVQQNYIDDEAWTRKGALVDDCAKKIVSNRMICAKILKAAIPEFKDCTEDEIAFYYLGDEFEISTRAVHMENADVPEDMFINEMNSEARGEKYSHDKIYFDIRFSALAPVKGKLVKLLFDIEIQNEFYPGYSLEKRAVYYASRMVSEQHGREFIGSDYNRIKKVYSIWLNTNPPKKYRHSIGYYNYSFTLAENSFDVKPDDYMLSNIVMINLGGNDGMSEEAEEQFICHDQTKKEMMVVLDALFLKGGSFEEVQKVLEENGVHLLVADKERLEKMYGLFNELRSDYVSILKQLKNTEEERDTMTKKYDASMVVIKRGVSSMITDGKSLGYICGFFGLPEEDIRAIARERNLTIKEDDTVLRA